MRWYRSVDCWVLYLSPWRYSALMASIVTTGMAAGHGLLLPRGELAEWFLLIGSSWLSAFLISRLIERCRSGSRP